LREDTRYTYAVGKIRALETRLLSPDKIERILSCPDAAAALKETGEWWIAPCGRELKGENPQEELERCLAGELVYVRDLILGLSPEKELTELFFVRYDFHNLKVLLKNAGGYGMGDKEVSDAVLDMGLVPSEDMEKAILSGDFSSLPVHIGRTVKKIKDKFRDSPELIDIVIDAEMYSFVNDVLARYTDSACYVFLKELFSAEADICNLGLLKRLKKLGRDAKYLNTAVLSGGKIEKKTLLRHYETSIGDMAQYIETQIERLRSSLIKLQESVKYNAFGLEPLVLYLKRKGEEASLIRMAVVGKVYGLSREEIKKRMDEIWLMSQR